MKKVMISPSRYVQGENEYYNLSEYIKAFGERAFLVVHKDDAERFKEYIAKVEEDTSITLITGDFKGECTQNQIDIFSEQAQNERCDVVLGLGGGKALDTAKAVGYFAKCPVIILPTIASTDAPTSYSAVLYTEDGTFDKYMSFKRNPDLVLVDTGIIAKAPVRFLVSGIGDALSTYFEARSCAISNADNIPGGKSTKAALAIARQCFETLLEDAETAKIACECKVVTPSLENIVEANILLSGLGFESSGLAAAHSIHNGFTALEETHKYFHGEKVAFGTIVHLVLENAPKEELEEVLNLCKAVGLPVCLADIGITEVTREKLMKVGEAACAEGETIHNMPFKVTPETVASAILVADRIGKSKNA